MVKLREEVEHHLVHFIAQSEIMNGQSISDPYDSNSSNLSEGCDLPDDL